MTTTPTGTRAALDAALIEWGTAVARGSGSAEARTALDRAIAAHVEAEVPDPRSRPARRRGRPPRGARRRGGGARAAGGAMTARPGEQRVSWSKRERDIVYSHGGDGACGSTARLLAYALEDVEVHQGRALRAELEARGYDLTTLRFSIRKKVQP